MDITLIMSTILGSAGVFSLIQYLVTRHDRKNDDLISIKKELKSMKKCYQDTNVRVTRMELSALIRDDPNNIDAILQVAEYYFIELDGNAYAHSVFEKWAVEHGVAIGWLPKLTKGVNHGKTQ
jgi:hypothetical protein